MDAALLLLHAIPEAVRVLRKDVSKISKRGLTASQYGVLYRILHTANTIQELAEAQGTSVPAISRMVDGLVQKKWVARKNSSKDRRSYHLSLTRKGMEELSRLISMMKVLQRKRMDQFSPLERKQLLSGIKMIQKFFAIEL